MGGGMEVNKNKWIEEWDSAKENLEHNFRWTRRNFAIIGVNTIQDIVVVDRYMKERKVLISPNKGMVALSNTFSVLVLDECNSVSRNAAGVRNEIGDSVVGFKGCKGASMHFVSQAGSSNIVVEVKMTDTDGCAVFSDGVQGRRLSVVVTELFPLLGNTTKVAVISKDSTPYSKVIKSTKTRQVPAHKY